MNKTLHIHAHRVIYTLTPTLEQAAALTATLQQFNRAAQTVADYACAHRVFGTHDLQRQTYSTLRGEYGLTAQMAIQAISKANDACHDTPRPTDQPMVAPKIEPHGPMVYDHRIMSLKGYTHVSLRCLNSREVMPLEFVLIDPRPRAGRSLGQAELVAHDGEFFLALTVDGSHRTPEMVQEIEDETAKWVASMQQISLDAATPIRWYLRTLVVLGFLRADLVDGPVLAAYAPADEVTSSTGVEVLA